MDDATLDDTTENTDATDRARHPFTDVPVEITVAVGKARPRLSDLLRMGQDAVLPLDSQVDDPVELYMGDRLIARGELQELEGSQTGQLAVRLTEVADLRTEL
ncbi:FliM/FliN family flagellar motor switch protein [Maribius pontilimi]|uniref:Flagellar motor switch protein FliN n=1 Tax=Palleronia pontilimi TaxID=1964209 RepID=A0A934I9X2_9RHOB|nr:FliM/FliN family flagellar motor switch protein [Palleronia pontilimi]MBJ3763194.1 FliM/FliN family flagellar motor switch protein [Palleronia pontilimi]